MTLGKLYLAGENNSAKTGLVAEGTMVPTPFLNILETFVEVALVAIKPDRG